MKKITFLLVILVGFWGVNAQQNRIMTKEQERAYLQTVKPVEHHYSHLRSPNATILSENFDSGLPATWTVVDNTGNGGWMGVTDYSGNTLDGTSFVMVNSDAAGQVDIDTELISPGVDVSAYTNVFISFDHYYRTYAGNDLAEVDVYDGTQWVNIYSASGADVGAWGNPDHQMIDVTAYKNANFKVRFHYYLANYEYWWAVDNFMIFEPAANDLAVTNVSPGAFTPNTQFPVKATVYNNGTNAQDDFDVTFNIKDASNTVVFTETVNVTGAGLLSGATYEVTSPTPVSLAVGNYTLEATVSLTGDADPGNDTYSAPLAIVDFPSTYNLDTVYSYVTYDGDSSGDDEHLVGFDINSGAVTDIGALVSSDFFISGTFINDVLVAVEYGTNNVYLIDGTGAAYKYGRFTGDVGSEIITGIAYDDATDTGYIATGTVLLTFDQNLNTVLVGPFNNAGTMIGVDVDNNGNLYGIDLVDDNLYSIDSATGVATVIGPLGFDIGYAQDIGADPTTGNLYGTLFNYDILAQAITVAGLFQIDKITGAATAIGTPDNSNEYVMCAILGTTASISENTIEGLNVYPNPTNGMILVNAKENIQKIDVINLTGQTVMSVDNGGMNAQLDITHLPFGSYILKITTDQTSATYQVIKK